MEFVQGAELIIHNAPFDLGFLDSELQRLSPSRGSVVDRCTVIDTLVMARSKHPGQRNSLDALCQRYEVDNSQRDLHGALLDAEILADVYLAITGGQTALQLSGSGNDQNGQSRMEPIVRLSGNRESLLVIKATPTELTAHEIQLEAIAAVSGGKVLWRDTAAEALVKP
jgi:DNA polymerase-3 subunit epsilon